MTRTVLVVDDDPLLRECLADILTAEGDGVQTAGDGHAALQAVQAHPPDLILLDYQMPRCDGPQFATAYRRHPGPPARIVLLAAAPSAPQRAQEVGAAGWLGTPFAVAALLDLVAPYAA